MTHASFGSDVVVLHEQLVAACADHRRGKARLARLLDQMDGLQGFRVFAASFDRYVEAYLLMAPRDARELQRVGKALRSLPQLAAAVDRGEVAWSKIREVVRVATPETDGAWLEAVGRESCRDIERMVARTKRGDEPPHPEDGLEPVAKQVRITIDGEASDVMLIRKMVTIWRQRMGEDEPARCDDAVILADIARTILANTAEQAGEHAPRDAFQVNVMTCPSSSTTTHVGRDTDVEVSPEVVEELACCAVEIDLTPGPEQGKIAQQVPPRTQRLVRARARFRCEIPGCEHSAWTHIHHVTPRNQGGSHEPSNLMVVCSGHHRRIHQGHLRAWRNEADQVEVERVPKEAWPSSVHWQLLRDVLSYHALHADQAAPVLGASVARTRAVLKYLERRNLVVQATSGEWFEAPGAQWPSA